MAELRDVLEKAIELTDMLNVRLGKIDAEKTAVAQDKAFCAEERKKLTTLSDNLSARESRIKKIEDAQAIIDKAGKDLEGVRGREAALGLDREKFEQFKQAETKKLEDLAATLRAQTERIEADRKQLAADYAAYKKRVIEEVTRELKTK